MSDEPLHFNTPTLGHYEERPLLAMIDDVTLGERVILRPFVNLYGCTIGDDTRVGAFTEIGKGVTIGKRCKIGARVFIPEGVTIGDDVFIGPGTTFTNDKHPAASGEWDLLKTQVEDGVSIGAGCVILPGLYIGPNAMVGAGTRVTKDVLGGMEIREDITYHKKRRL